MSQPTVKLDRDELACLNELFGESEDFGGVTDKLPLDGSIPTPLLELFKKGKFSLLGELEDYQLLFPLTFEETPAGTVKPVLGAPDVIELDGGERSWRVKNVKDVHVHLPNLDLTTITSLSGTGMALSLPKKQAKALMDSALTVVMTLPNHPQPLSLRARAIRYEGGQLALRFQQPEHTDEALRDYLFEQHQDRHKELYYRLGAEEAAADDSKTD